jgi:DNA mismatch endonuclease (patch repair protein)
MSDVFSKAKRSEVMARIRGRGNVDTEIAFMRLLRVQGITGWRRHLELSLEPADSSQSVKKKGRRRRVKPDFVFPTHRLAVFIDGCFWHSCPRHATEPKNNGAFWAAKLAANRARDRYVTSALRRQGWQVMRIWEHDVQQNNAVADRLRRSLHCSLNSARSGP